MRAALEQQNDAGRELAHALDDHTGEPHPKRSVLGIIRGGIKTLIQSRALATDVVVHGHKRLTAAQHWLSAVH